MAQYKEKLLKDKLDYLEETKALIKNVLQELGADVSDEDTFRDYVNILGTLKTGEVLLFSTVEEMSAYPNPPNGKYAVVYQQQFQPLDRTSAEHITIPNGNVVMDKVVDTPYSERLFGKNFTDIGFINITSRSCTISITYNGASLTATFNTENGIDYYLVSKTNNNFEEIDNIYTIPCTIRFNNKQTMMYPLYNFIYSVHGTFGGLYKCINGTFIQVINQFELDTNNQILLNGYNCYGKNGIVRGDGSYISNIPVYDYIQKYLPSLKNDSRTVCCDIQKGTQSRVMDYVQRKQLKIYDAFNNTFPLDDAVVQNVYTNTVTSDVPNEYKVLIQNYLNAQVRYNQTLLIGNIECKLYIGYNYSTKSQLNEYGVSYTVPYQVTSVYGFIINLNDLSIYKTFENTDTWLFTDAGFGDVLLFGYSANDDSIILACDTNGWSLIDGAHISITKIQADTGVRNTNYYTPNFSGDYEYKSIAYVSYNSTQDCYYLAYRTSMSSNGGNNNIKRICKLTSDGIITSVFESVEKMENLPILWTHYLQDNGSLLYYKTATKGDVLRNLENNIEITLYGSTLADKEYWVQDINNIYVSHKMNPNDSVYNVCAIDKVTLNATIIPNTESSSRITMAYFRYNNDLCIFRNNKIISLQGDVVGQFYLYGLGTQGVSGIIKLDDYTYKMSSIYNATSVTNNKISSNCLIYKYFNYSKISSFPVHNDICIVTSDIKSTATNSSNTLYKYMSIPLTDMTLVE